jgi:hypothetical protein
MGSEIKANEDISYLDLQGLAGVSKHTGGFPATEELLSMCHIEDASEALASALAPRTWPASTACTWWPSTSQRRC